MEPLLPREPTPHCSIALALERAGAVWEVGLACIYCVNPAAQRCCARYLAALARAQPVGRSQLSERHEGHLKI